MTTARPDGVPTDAVDISDDGGLCKRILTAGDPAEGTPFEGAEVQVHYVGTLLSDGSKFDSSRDRPGNFKFKIGQGQVIKGWDQGVATMHKGEKAELFCRADYAYGESGSPPKIPGGATLKFEVELLSWAEPVKSKWEYSAKEKLEQAATRKAEATAAFKAGQWSGARDSYVEASEWVEHDYDFVDELDKTAARDMLSSCLLNAAQCLLKLSDWPEVAAKCTKVLGIAGLADAARLKALYRRGLAHIKMADFEEARACSPCVPRGTTRRSLQAHSMLLALLRQASARVRSPRCVTDRC